MSTTSIGLIDMIAAIVFAVLIYKIVKWIFKSNECGLPKRSSIRIIQDERACASVVTELRSYVKLNSNQL